MKNTYVITGAAGFIGYHLSKRLLEMKEEVIGIDNLNDYYDLRLKKDRLSILKEYKNFKFYEMDINDSNEMNNIFNTYKPSHVINLAAQAGVRYSIDNPSAYMHSNINGFFVILELCRKYNIRHFIFASSSSVYGQSKKIPFSTGDNVDKPISFYAATKKCDELMAYSYSHLFNIPITGLRFFTVYGPFGRPDMAYYSFTKNIIEGNPIKVYNNGDMLRDFTYVDDIIDGILLIINNIPLPDENNTRYKIYNIGNNHPEQLNYFISLIEKYTERTAIKENYPMQKGDVYSTYADISDMSNDVGFKPKVSIEEGLKKFVDWYIDYQNKG